MLRRRCKCVADDAFPDKIEYTPGGQVCYALEYTVLVYLCNLVY